jgi:ankyrin repeat protein
MAQLAFSNESEHSPTFNSLLYNLDTDVLDTLEFSMLHKCILDLAQLSLIKQLILSPEEINRPDSGGQTPLFWATVRGNSSAVKTLLDYGADPNFLNKLGETPLHWATETNNSACLTLLLERGARPSPKSVFGTTPLHYSVWKDSTISQVKELLRFGADVSIKNNRGQVPLHYTVDCNSVKTASCLIQAGAQLDVKDEDGATPLFASLRADSADLTRLFLELGASVHEKTPTGNTILHVVAEKSNVRTIDVLAESGVLAGMTVNVKNSDGKLPRRLFLDRADCNEELITAFEKLAATLEFKRSSATGFGEASKSSGTIGNDAFSTKLGEISVEVAEVFEDAVEYHEHYADYGATVMEAAIPQDSVV